LQPEQKENVNTNTQLNVKITDDFSLDENSIKYVCYEAGGQQGEWKGMSCSGNETEKTCSVDLQLKYETQYTCKVTASDYSENTKEEEISFTTAEKNWLVIEILQPSSRNFSKNETIQFEVRLTSDLEIKNPEVSSIPPLSWTKNDQGIWRAEYSPGGWKSPNKLEFTIQAKGEVYGKVRSVTTKIILQANPVNISSELTKKDLSPGGPVNIEVIAKYPDGSKFEGSYSGSVTFLPRGDICPLIFSGTSGHTSPSNTTCVISLNDKYIIANVSGSDGYNSFEVSERFLGPSSAFKIDLIKPKEVNLGKAIDAYFNITDKDGKTIQVNFSCNNVSGKFDKGYHIVTIPGAKKGTKLLELNCLGILGPDEVEEHFAIPVFDTIYTNFNVTEIDATKEYNLSAFYVSGEVANITKITLTLGNSTIEIPMGALTKIDLKIPEGDYNLTIFATDEYGNILNYTLPIHYKPKKELFTIFLENIPLIAGFLFALGVLATLFSEIKLRLKLRKYFKQLEKIRKEIEAEFLTFATTKDEETTKRTISYYQSQAELIRQELFELLQKHKSFMKIAEKKAREAADNAFRKAPPFFTKEGIVNYIRNYGIGKDRCVEIYEEIENKYISELKKIPKDQRKQWLDSKAFTEHRAKTILSKVEESEKSF
ncbi:MAG: LapA family protein, partial [archaeon]